MNEGAKALYWTFREFINTLILVAFIFMVGCSHLRPAKDEISPSFPAPEEIISDLKRKNNEISSLRGTMTIEVRSMGKRYRIQEAFQIQKPSKIRMQTLGIFGQPVFFLTTDGNTLSVFVPSENRLYLGEASVENLSLGIHLPLSPYQIVSILTGEIPIIECKEFISGFDQREGLFSLDTGDRGDGLPRQKLWIDLKRAKCVKGELWDDKGELIWRVLYRRFHDLSGITLPFSIDIETAQGKTKASIELEDVEINPEIKGESFDLQVPEGTEIRFLK